ncbi:hypothetical protein JG687_00002142 [Phytophthora cactorum]|uniref:Uncharacterized protein n=1 Tax=Phytophthora cactorum TaxID=29920 RepID=A0A329T106_9STRA|nr:hypothetical protein Pcac1_g17458 [Phytophthora cactorum]KAG2828766.1 hypothetical protein PC112_g8349 [Phytophthora cactorum]KAG2831264.1 hypothetical protein PC111_g7079 [Phytophthora cactorum]KAG2859463.1 hypothetical protein PC113_g8923 [Phytophthora cactorum]KAG2912959.1 hypothetical protein PC114_g8718 [Phytophthora cactorum]
MDEGGRYCGDVDTMDGLEGELSGGDEMDTDLSLLEDDDEDEEMFALQLMFLDLVAEGVKKSRGGSCPGKSPDKACDFKRRCECMLQQYFVPDSMYNAEDFRSCICDEAVASKLGTHVPKTWKVSRQTTTSNKEAPIV